LVLTNDVLGNRQAQAGAVGTPADHGIEDGFLQFGRDTRADVDDLDLGHQAMADMAD
jgi:hypothetical protein